MKRLHRFSIKLMIAAIPFLLLMMVYAICDPFKTIHPQVPFYPEEGYRGVELNSQYVTLKTYEQLYPTENYDSYIFGNSRSEHFKIEDWQKHIEANTHCYHFNSSAESLYTMMRKMQYIDSKGQRIKNALISLDTDMFIQKESMQMLPPELSDNNYFRLNIDCFTKFLNVKFIYAYFYHRFTGNISMATWEVMKDDYIYYNYKTNEIAYRIDEQALQNDTVRLRRFREAARPDSVSFQELDDIQRDRLITMSDILKKHHTNYKIVINPLWNKIKINPEDLSFLKKTFGADKIYDFSGVNEITTDVNNYFEWSHFRPEVARKIMQVVYEETDSIPLQ